LLLKEEHVRVFLTTLALIAVLCGTIFCQNPATPKATYTLTVYVEGLNATGGNIGIMLFQNDKGWPDNHPSAFKDVEQPAKEGTVKFVVPGVPAGSYAISSCHDANKNGKLDKNFVGKPTEQWGMSNNPHATLHAPGFDKAKFEVTKDTELHIQMQ
jgi:uncharacterized protein (DUF2141 family)